jgi:hypothetical protein
MSTIIQDLRYALRTLRRSPGFTLIAVFALAVGIGSNTAIFSLIDSSRRQALPYPDPDRLVELWGNVLRARVERRGASYPDFQDWRAQSRSFDDMAAFDSQWITLTRLDRGAGAPGVIDEPERILSEFVSAPYFSLLGVNAAQGRTFRTDEDVVRRQRRSLCSATHSGGAASTRTPPSSAAASRCAARRGSTPSSASCRPASRDSPTRRSCGCRSRCMRHQAPWRSAVPEGSPRSRD